MKIFTREPKEAVLLEAEQVLVGLAVGLEQGLLLQRPLPKDLHQLRSQLQKDPLPKSQPQLPKDLLPNQPPKDRLPSQFLLDQHLLPKGQLLRDQPDQHLLPKGQRLGHSPRDPHLNPLRLDPLLSPSVRLQLPKGQLLLRSQWLP